ncbi:hypothetical protein FDO65_03005 [Nakamurella flava]|uniref:Uncharacterized protein n=1 Tax=Nakamurella flava TaxID=2576308 RepID=A0A4U6QKL9_9ACTN|nr:hypothetical protein [Nakamurella flava]TKV60676.1 hypothetical protein FDO65_03005 [Nakamurella flava]
MNGAGGRRWGRTAAVVLGAGVLTFGLSACGGTTTVTTVSSGASTSAPSTAAAAPTGGVVTVGAESVVVPLVTSNGTKVGTVTVGPDGSLSNDDLTKNEDVPDDPNGTDVVTTLVDSNGAKMGTITVRPDGSVISITGTGTVTTGSGDVPGMSMPEMSMPDMSMPEMRMDMSGMPTPTGRPGDQVNDSVNTGGAPTTIAHTSCNSDGSQCNRSEIILN